MGAPLQTFSKAAGVFAAAQFAPIYPKSIAAENRNAAVRYLMLFDQVSTPMASQVPMVQFAISASSPTTFTVGFMSFQSGLAWAFSTASGALTIGTDADHDIMVLQS